MAVESAIVWICVCTLISNSAYALIAPFLPLEFKMKGIDALHVGLIFAIYSVAVIFMSPCVSKILPKWGYANTISFGVLLMGIAFALFSEIDNMENTHIITGYALVLRFVQGISSALVQTTCYCIATNDFPEKKTQIVGLVEAITGIGCILGPVIGSTLYFFLGFKQTFLVYGSFLIFLAIVIKINFSHKSLQEQQQLLIEDDFSEAMPPLNTTIENVSQLNEQSPFLNKSIENENVKKVTVCGLLCNARFTLAALSGSLCYFLCCFMEPILAERLQDFSLNQLQIGLFFSIWAFFYIPSSMAVQYVPTTIENRVLIILASICCSVAFIFVGPSQLLAFKESLFLMGLGQALVGIFSSILIVPGLPEMIESALIEHPDQENEVNNLSSGIFNAALGIGQILAPTYGSIANTSLGFRLTTDIVSIVCLFFGVIYFILGNGFQAFVDTHKNLRGTRQPFQHLAANSGDAHSPLLANLKSHDFDDKSSFLGRTSFGLMPKSPGIFYSKKQSIQDSSDRITLAEMRRFQRFSSFADHTPGLALAQRRMRDTEMQLEIIKQDDNWSDINTQD